MAQRTDRGKKAGSLLVAPKSSGGAVPGLIVAATAVWGVIVAARVAHGLELGRSFDRWLLTDFSVLPSLQATAGHFGRLCAAAAITLALLGVGRRVLRAARFSAHNVWEEAAFSFGLGYGFIATLLLLLGVGGFWGRGVLVGFLLLSGLGGLAGLRELLNSARLALARAGAESDRPDAVGSCAASFVILVWLYELRYALIPETFYDALVYHLALPARYLLDAQIVPTPLNSFSGVPGLPQMISGLALAVEPWGIVASILHWSLLPWCCVALIGLSRRLGRPKAGVLAAVIFSATPVVIGESFRVSVGVEWAFFELCCLAAVLAAAEDGLSRPAAALAGCFLGFAMATKYPAWLLALAVVPTLTLGRLSSLDERRRLFAAFAASACVALIFVAPWILKNVAFYSNPLYPFFHERFAPSGASIPDWRQISAAGTDFGRLLTPAGLGNYLLHPWHFLNPPENVTETTGPVYLALLPGLLLFPLERRGRLVALFALAAWTPLSVLTPQSRYFIPHLAVVALLVAYLVEGVEPDWARRFFRGGALGLAALCALGWAVTDSNRAKLPVFLGRRDFSDYLSHTTVSYPAPPYAAYRYLNESTPPDARVLVYGETRGYYLKRDAILSSADQRSSLELWADESPSPAALAERLRRERISFVLVNAGEIKRLYLAPRLSPSGLRVLDGFWKRYTLRVFGVFDPGDRWVGVYRLLDESEAARPHPVDDLFGGYVKKLP